MRDDAADETPVECRLRIDHVTGVEQLRRARLADDARQDPRPAIAGNDAELEKGNAELRPVGSDAHVRKTGEIAAQPDRWPVHRRDQRDAQTVQRAQHLVDVVTITVRNLRRSTAECSGPLLHRLDVAARTEGPPRSGENHTANIHVRIDRIAGRREGIPVALRAERIHRLGAVEGKRGDVIGGVGGEQGHGRKVLS